MNKLGNLSLILKIFDQFAILLSKFFLVFVDLDLVMSVVSEFQV